MRRFGSRSRRPKKRTDSVVRRFVAAGTAWLWVDVDHLVCAAGPRERFSAGCESRAGVVVRGGGLGGPRARLDHGPPVVATARPCEADTTAAAGGRLGVVDRSLRANRPGKVLGHSGDSAVRSAVARRVSATRANGTRRTLAAHVLDETGGGRGPRSGDRTHGRATRHRR